MLPDDVCYKKPIWGERQLGVKKALTTSHLCSTTVSLKLLHEALAIAGHQEMGRKIMDQEEKGLCSSSVIKVTCGARRFSRRFLPQLLLLPGWQKRPMALLHCPNINKRQRTTHHIVESKGDQGRNTTVLRKGSSEASVCAGCRAAGFNWGPHLLEQTTPKRGARDPGSFSRS